MGKIFLALLVNTAVIIWVINWDGPFSALHRGPYSESVRGWYATVGGQIVTTMAINSLMTGGMAFVTGQIGRLVRFFTKGNHKTHAELIEAYTPPEFDISSRFAQTLMTFFTTMMFGAGSPILYLFAAIYCFMTYWGDKFFLLKCCKSPPIYNCALPKESATIMMVAAPLHVIGALWMFSSTCTFPSEPFGAAIDGLETPELDGGMMERLFLKTTWLLSAILIVYIALLIIGGILKAAGAGVGDMINSMKEMCCGGSNSVKDASKEDQEAAANRLREQPRGI